jgi:hypothetical protein
MPRAGYQPVAGMRPDGTGEQEFHVPISRLLHLQRNGPKQAYFDGLLLDEVLSEPLVIFQGLKRDGYENAYSYCKLPSRRFRDRDVQIPWDPIRTYLAFVSTNFVVFGWEPREVDPTKPGFPLLKQNERGEPDLGKVIWP